MLHSLLYRSGKALVLAALTLGFAAGTVLAQTGRVEGTVRNSRTGDPVASARVTLIGTALAGTTNENGYYAIASVPVGTYNVRVNIIGYQSATVTNQLVAAGLPTAVNFSLNSSILRIEGVVVTGVVQETQAIKLAFTVDQILADELSNVPAPNPEEALRGKVAGAKVVKGGGQPGAPTSVLLRGATAIDVTGRSNEPLYIVDGVILGSSMVDLDALDIDNIQVVKGAAAASVYGARAGNGVVNITTRRGRNLPEGETRITLRSEFGFSELAEKVKVNNSHQFCTDGTNYTDCAGNIADRSIEVGAPGGRVADTTTFAGCGETETFCHFQNHPFPSAVPTFDQQDRFFGNGLAFTNSISISHRTSSSNFLASFADTKEEGILPFVDGYRRRSLRLNVDHSVGQLDFAASGYYAQSNRDAVRANENAQGGGTEGGGAFFGLTFMAPDVDLLELNNPLTSTSSAKDSVDFVVNPDPDVLRNNPIYELANRDIEDRRSRVLGNITATWRPVEFFDFEGNFSFDRSDRNRNDFRDKGYRSIGDSEVDGRISKTNTITQAVNASLTAGARWTLGGLNGTSKIRVLAERQESDFFESFGQGLEVAEVPDLDNAGGTVQIQSDNIEVRSLGYFFITGVDYNDKYIADFLVRRDGSSLFGPDQRWQTYYRVSGAYRMAQEDWWPIAVLDEFKLRASYGTAGGRPSFDAQFETFNVVGGNISKFQLGNKDLKPEFVKEFEGGIDLIAAGRLSLGVTYAKSISEDQILNVPLPSSQGFQSQWQNAGTLESNTWEASLQFGLIQSQDINWSWNVVVDRTRQNITEFTPPPFLFGAGNQSGNLFFNRPNEEFGSMYGFRWVTGCSGLSFYGIDASECGANFQVNDEGYLVATGSGNSFTDGISGLLWGTSVTTTGGSFNWGEPIKELGLAANGRDTTNILKIGRATSDYNLGVSQTFRYKRFSLYTLFDSQIGGDIYNQTRQWNMSEDRSFRSDQKDKPATLLKTVNYYKVLYATLDPNSELVESGTYLKIREVALRYTFDRSQLEGILSGALSRISVALIGRNLHTFTGYTGFDPEVGLGGDQAATLRFDAFTYPNFRSFSATVEVEF